jgi:hypothetical protein
MRRSSYPSESDTNIAAWCIVIGLPIYIAIELWMWLR